MATISLFGNLQTTDAFAAGKKNNKPTKKKGSKNVVGKGFGSSTGPTLEEVVAGIPNRIPSNPLECECPCGVFPGKLYKDCCEPFHSKEKLPASPMDVLRTRYTAFAWRMPLYIVDTTHPECDDWRKDRVTWVKDLHRDGMFDSYDFVNLEMGDQEISEDNDKEGFLEFKVNLRANESMGDEVKGQEIVVNERSKFICAGNPASWLYAGGDVTSDVAGLEDVILNQ